MKKIPLTQGKFALVDEADYAKVSEFKWQAEPHSGIWYARRDEGGRKAKKKIYLHRFITDAPAGKHVDHKNKNGLDNRQSNLRVCTASENLQNRGKQKNNKSGFKGVYWNKHAKKWHACIAANKKRFSLGYYDSVQDAAVAYKQAALKYHGEFAKQS